MAVVVRAAGRFQAHTILDIVERQVLFGLEALNQGCRYEHHVLLVRLDGSRWVCFDCSLDVEVYDLKDEEEITPLDRHSQFPIEGRPILALDLMDADALSAFRSRAAQLADMLGGITAVVPTDDSVWMFSDTAHPFFGKPVPMGSLQGVDNLAVRGSMGLVFA